MIVGCDHSKLRVDFTVGVGYPFLANLKGGSLRREEAMEKWAPLKL